jgi:hypothetical protein
VTGENIIIIIIIMRISSSCGSSGDFSGGKKSKFSEHHALNLRDFNSRASQKPFHMQTGSATDTRNCINPSVQ